MLTWIKQKLFKKSCPIAASLHTMVHTHQLFQDRSTCAALRMYMARHTDKAITRKLKELNNPDSFTKDSMETYIQELKDWNADLGHPVLIEPSEMAKMTIVDWFEVEAQLCEQAIEIERKIWTDSSVAYGSTLQTAIANKDCDVPLVLSAATCSPVIGFAKYLIRADGKVTAALQAVIFFAVLLGMTTVICRILSMLIATPIGMWQSILIAAVGIAGLGVLASGCAIFRYDEKQDEFKTANVFLSQVSEQWDTLYQRQTALDCWIMAATYFEFKYRHRVDDAELVGIKGWSPKDAIAYQFVKNSSYFGKVRQILARLKQKETISAQLAALTLPRTNPSACVLVDNADAIMNPRH